jgi:hypothetical protein
MRLGIFIPVPDAILLKDDRWEKEMVRKFHLEEKMRLLIKLVQQGLFLGMVFSLLFMQTSNANATMFDLTYYNGGITTTNDISSNGGSTYPPFNSNANPGGNTQYFTNTPTNSYPIDATYSTNQGTITSDISTSLIVSSANAISFNNSASITNSFPSSLNYGVKGAMDINFNGIYTGNGSEITIPITYSANFSNGSSTVQNGVEFFFGSLSGASNNLTFTAPTNISTGNGTIADLTFQSIVGQTYVLTVSEGLSGNVLGNASADLTFLIGAPISQTPVSATPEPPTFWLMATGILGMLGMAGYRKMRASA